MTRQGAAGSGPGAKRTAASRTQRTRAASPTRRVARPVRDKASQTALTGRAAILVLAVALVMLAVALPLKIWMGQRGTIASQSAAIRRTEAKVGQLRAQAHQLNSPSYIEQQARDRLHYVMPGQKTVVVLGHQIRSPKAAAAHRKAVASASPWYTQFWTSVQAAGAAHAAS